MAIIVLPPNSTATDLQTTINNAGFGDIIEIPNNITLVESIVIPADSNLMIRSNIGHNWSLIQTVPGAKHFMANDSLVLQNITLEEKIVGNGIQLTHVTNSIGVFEIENEVQLRATVVEVTDEEQLRDAIAGAGTTPTVIIINVDIVLTGVAIGGTLIIAAGQDITLQGIGSITSSPGSRTINLGVAGSVGTGIPSTLTLRGDLTLYGNGTTVAGGGIFVTNNSVLNMYDNVTITNHLLVNGSQPEFGPIGVVRLWDGGTFNMHGGSIVGNVANSGGSVHVGVNSTFNMFDGIIADNSTLGGAGSPFGGGAGTGAGVRLDSTTAVFNMYDGEIRDNITRATSSGHGGGVAVLSGATFNMNGGIISGNTAGDAVAQGGGIAVINNSIFNMHGGTIINNSAVQGGGVVIIAEVGQLGSTFNMYDGAVITDNTARTNAGGGAMIHTGSTFTMYGGEISLNESLLGIGGGVAVDGASSFTMHNGEIIENTANIFGGGVAVLNGSFIMNTGFISGNTVNNHGGGIFVSAISTANISGASFITNNSAPNGEGGGIYTAAFMDYANLTLADYQNITTSDTVVFSGNSAFQAFYPPAIAPSYTNIQYASTSIIGPTGFINPINNYDINFIGNEPLNLFSVIYNANGGMGGPHTDVIFGNTAYTIHTPASVGISRAGYTFVGWNTAPDGSGTPYAPGQIVTITDNLILYAQWEPIGKEVDCCLIILLFLGIFCRPKKKCCCKCCCKHCCKHCK